MKRVIPFLIFIGLLLSLGGCKYFEKQKHRLFSKDIDTLLDVTNKPKDTIPVDTTPPAPQQPVAQPVQQPTVNETEYGYGSEKYYMIAGSFQNVNFAKRYAAKMHDMGYNTRIIQASNGFYRVSVKSYNNFSKGVGEIEQFRSNVSARAWLNVKK